MNRICNTILALIIVSVLAVFIGARAYPALNGYTGIHIQGRSMEPLIPLSALAYVQSQERYTIGDVVSYRAGSTIVTHALVGEWTGDGHSGPWQTQGAANTAPDAQLVPTANIIGRVVGHVPLVGLAVTLLTEPPVIIFLLILTALILYLPGAFEHG